MVLGRADAMSADSPVTQYAVSQTDGKLELSGDIFDAAPFGVALAKDGDMTQAVQASPAVPDGRRHLPGDPRTVGR